LEILIGGAVLGVGETVKVEGFSFEFRVSSFEFLFQALAVAAEVGDEAVEAGKIGLRGEVSPGSAVGGHHVKKKKGVAVGRVSEVVVGDKADAVGSGEFNYVWHELMSEKCKSKSCSAKVTNLN
jgi:hypothetical protein